MFIIMSYVCKMCMSSFVLFSTSARFDPVKNPDNNIIIIIIIIIMMMIMMMMMMIIIISNIIYACQFFLSRSNQKH